MTDTEGIRRKRSPSHPYINLKQAVEFASIIYEKEGLSPAPANVVLGHLNYSPTGSSGIRVLSSMLQFGLLNEDGVGENKRVWLSDSAMTILESPDEKERYRVLRYAALRPDVHQEVWEKWQLAHNTLPSPQNMRFVLLREMEFHKNAVDFFLDEFRETYEYARLDTHVDDTPNSDLKPDIPQENVSKPTPGSPSPNTQQSPPGSKEHTIQLIGQPMARLILPHPISERNLQHLISWLQLMGPALTSPENNTFEDNYDSEMDQP